MKDDQFAEAFAGSMFVAGVAAKQQPDAPQEGWFMQWLDADGESHRSYVVTDSCQPLVVPRPVTTAAVRVVGLFHDEYFPCPGASD